MLGSGTVRGNERQVDLGLDGSGELDLGALRGFLEPLQRHLVGRQVDALVFLELLDHPLDDALVEVVAAEMGVTARRKNLDDAVTDLQNGNVERAAAEVEHRDGLLFLLVEAVGQSRCGGLVDDPLNV